MKETMERKVVFLLFFASGVSGLVYEVVWLRMLSRIIGVTTYATAVTLAAFMLGLAVGSFVFGKLTDKREDQLKIYALLQWLLAVAAVITPFILKTSIPLYKYVYQISNQNIDLILMVKIFVSFASLLIPAALMGGTLPVLTSYMVKRRGMFGRNFSLLYGLNTLGAVFGVLLSGFITIGAVGEWNTIFIGVAINCVVGFIALLLYSKAGENIQEVEISENIDSTISPYSGAIRKMVLVSIFMSGFTALAYEVIWTRQLILFLRTSIYAFSAMLAVFLTGIAIGSIVVNKFIDRLKTPLVVFGILELGIGVLSISNLYLLRPLDSSLLSRMLSPVVLVFPLTFLFGAIFPIASLCYAKSINKTGSSVAAVYCFNTMGNVIGSVLTGFLLIGLFGSSKTIIALGFVNIMLGLILLWAEPAKSVAFKSKYLLIIPIVILLSVGFKGKDPFLNIIEKRITADADSYEVFLNQETVEGTVTSFMKNGLKGLWVNGVGYTTLLTENKLMAHLPVMLADNPQKALVICFGMGTTVRAACIYDDLDITSVELVPKIYECFKYHHPDTEEILSREGLDFVSGDGRNFLLLSSEKYDVITVDPSAPIYNAGTVNLYTREFLSLCKEHLSPDGVMCLWFPRGSKDDTGAILKTFYSVFPNMTAWVSPHEWGIYLVGTLAPTEINVKRIEKAFGNPRLLKDLGEYDNSCVTSSQLLNLLIIDKNNIGSFIKDAPVITDNYPYTEFPLWRWVSRAIKGEKGAGQ